jgi:hypothetical protein
VVDEIEKAGEIAAAAALLVCVWQQPRLAGVCVCVSVVAVVMMMVRRMQEK